MAPLHCGGTRIAFGTTLGVARTGNDAPWHARSLEALSTIVDSNRTVVGWLGVDEAAHFWVQFAPGSPLKRTLGPNVIAPPPGVLFGVLKTKGLDLPTGYALEACEFHKP